MVSLDEHSSVVAISARRLTPVGRRKEQEVITRVFRGPSSARSRTAPAALRTWAGWLTSLWTVGTGGSGRAALCDLGGASAWAHWHEVQAEVKSLGKLASLDEISQATRRGLNMQALAYRDGKERHGPIEESMPPPLGPRCQKETTRNGLASGHDAREASSDQRPGGGPRVPWQGLGGTKPIGQRQCSRCPMCNAQCTAHVTNPNEPYCSHSLQSTKFHRPFI